MMGAVAESHLGKSLVSATVFMAVLLFILSVVPFYLKQNQEAEKLARDEAPSSDASSSEQEKESEYVPEVGEVGEKSLTTPEQSTADALGIGEQKLQTPNPTLSTPLARIFSTVSTTFEPANACLRSMSESETVSRSLRQPIVLNLHFCGRLVLPLV